MELIFKRVDINEDNIFKLESARYNAYGIESFEIPCDESFYANELRKNKYVVYSAFLNDELIGGCYISNSQHNLYVEQLFVKNQFQSLEIGKQLLLFALYNKKEIEQYFGEVYNYSYLSTRDNSLNKYYEELGYKSINDVYMKKTI